ncbi:ABC transporter permease [Paracoccus jiaweipingae]|uniref:ABC transporter permease n=1 Tax=unclassified Paracoccus (in: a-proteobacteria) TaxID=2688777 RepID=UPI0037B429A6
MFGGRSNKTLIGATFTTLALIHVVTVHNLRKANRSPIWGLLQSMMQAAMMILFFVGMYSFMKQRSSPIRGDFLMFLMSGVALFMIHVQTVGAMNAGSSLSAMNKHDPINPFIMICASALSALYTQTLSIAVMLFLYDTLIGEVKIDQPVPAMGMFMLAWFSGICVGMVFMAAKPWWPKGVNVISMVYRRGSMIASGKMFAANSLPAMVLPMFSWHPLFHIIDQNRGYVFINYNPHNSNLTYPVALSLSLLAIGLMAEFVTRRSESLSWTAGK